MITVDALGDTCPIPIVKTKKAIAELKEAGEVLTLVDNEISVQNLGKMARQKGYGFAWEKRAADVYAVTLTVGGPVAASGESQEEVSAYCGAPVPAIAPAPPATVVVIGCNTMGRGDDELGAILMRGFIFSLSQLPVMPQAVLFFNSGVKLTCKGSSSLDDLKALEANGVQIVSCGTCLNFYKLTDELQVGESTNMYGLVEIMSQADKIIKP